MKKFTVASKLVVALFVFILVVGQPQSWATHTQELQNKQDQLDKIDDQKEKVQKDISDLKYKEAELSLEMRALDKRMSDTQEQLDVIQGDLNVTTKKRKETESQLELVNNILREKTRELEALGLEVEKDQEILEKRMVDSYKQGKISYLEVLLNSQGFGDFLSRFYLLQQIVRSDHDILQKMQAAKAETAQKKKEVESEQARVAEIRRQSLIEEQRISTLRNAQKEKRDALSWEAKRKNQIFSEVQLDRLRLQAFERELDQTESQLIADIRSLEDRYSDMPRVGNGKFSWPATGRISSEFGMRIHPITKKRRLHAGIDIANDPGTPIKAAEGGVVIVSGVRGGYGNTVVISHGGGYSTLYAHASKLLVSVGETVEVGQTIAKMGSTGHSTGNHLHFEVRVNGNPENPRKYL